MKDLKSALSLVVVSFFLLTMSTACTSMSGDDTSLAPESIEEQPFFARPYREIQIPPGFVFDQKHSDFVETSSFRGGILQYSGRREINSVAEFFKNNMPKHQWNRVYVDTGIPMVQAYVQQNKTCMIMISETTMKTTIVIYVSDTTNESNADPLAQ